MIEIKNLCKIFLTEMKTKKIAVDNLSFKVNDGEIFGLLGKNGAGKTTTIRMLTMQIVPTSGNIFFDDKSIDEDTIEIKKMIGVVPQHINFDQDLTVGENMELHARLHHIKKIDRQKRIADLLNYVELNDVINENVRKLSGGMKRRLLIIRALIHQPKILFLDEPTVALDPQVRRKIWSLIKDLKSQGVTIFLTTHYIEEAESLCDRTAFLNRGKLIALDTPKNLCEVHNKNSLEEVFIKLTGLSVS
ncbi:MAG: ABC transporter ATP-binding protein [Selenomonadaceae bacterium]|nr:ABC transporter ATP-binding protein [Selenomonadaceae bacterium]